MTTVLLVKQVVPQETRVALVPLVVGKLIARGISVRVERGAGVGSHYSDEAYTQAGAQIVSENDAASWSAADIVVTVHPPTPAQIRNMKRGAVLLGLLAPLKHPDVVRALAETGITSFSAEFIPRISRAQAMDVLSSQASIAGYKAVLLAANEAPKLFPMLMTAAGTIAPCRVLVLGAGVAGLQAIATAKRLGAVVEAYDVRPAVKEQVQSLGGRFIELPTTTADAETAGGYAKEQSEEQRQRQIELMARHFIAADAVIATAAVFGKAPPLLIPAATVARMNAGSVIVDIAADPEAGRGNCELTQPGRRITTDRGVIIDGTLNLPALLPVHSSQMYANNVLAFLSEILPAPANGSEDPVTVKLDLTDDVQKPAVITHGGAVVNAMVKSALNL